MKFVVLSLSLMVLAGCAEVHRSHNRFAATGTSANILFFQVPKDPMISAESKVPADANVTNVNSSPNDWRTLTGFFNRLLGVGWVQIGGTASGPAGDK